jgi:hypothetical protein
MAGDKWRTFEGVELSVDRLKHVFVRLLFVWMSMDDNCPSSLLEFLDFLHW